jgi:hypothetical protein
MDAPTEIILNTEFVLLPVPVHVLLSQDTQRQQLQQQKNAMAKMATPVCTFPPPFLLNKKWWRHLVSMRGGPGAQWNIVSCGLLYICDVHGCAAYKNRAHWAQLEI